MLHFKRTAVAIVAAATAALASAAHADADKCNGLSGYYGGATAIIVGADGHSLSVILDGGRPNAYGWCSGGKLIVGFTDDQVIAGTWDGRAIDWDNGTSWTKVRR